MEILVSCLNKMDESQQEESQTVHNILGIIENLIELKPSVASDIVKKTEIFKWLLNRLQNATFDINKL